MILNLAKGFKNKKASVLWDKSCNFCDTTQIDVFLPTPTRFAYHHTHLIDNG